MTVRLGAVLLAAGASSRFGGSNKLLAHLKGKALVRYAAEAVANAGLAEMIAVTGRDAEAVRAALSGVALRFVHNRDWPDGMGGSVAAGVRALAPDIKGAFVVPGDMPFLTADVFHLLARAFEESAHHSIVFPTTPDGEQRNPVLWPNRRFEKLAKLSGPQGAKPLLTAVAAETRAVTIPQAAALYDVDSPDDLARAAALIATA